MKTILIYDQCGEAPVRFAVLDGDYSRLNRIYVNNIRCDESLCDELSDLVHDKKGHEILHFTETFPKEVLLAHPDTKVIVAGFLP